MRYTEKDLRNIKLTQFLDALGEKPVKEFDDFKLYYAPYRDDPEPTLMVNDKLKRWYDESTDEMGNLRELAMLTAHGDHTKDITAYILKMMNENERAKEMLEVAKKPLSPDVITLDIKNIRLTDFMKALGYQYPMAADGNLRMYPVPYSNDTAPNLVINIQTNQWRDIKSGAYGGIYDLAYELTGSCNMSELNHYIAGQMNGLKPEGLLMKKQEQPKVEPPKQEQPKPQRKMKM